LSVHVSPDPRPLKVLVVKLSSLGDVVHAMAAVQDIRRAIPDARIDWVVERSFAPLVARCEGVQRVIACNLRHWTKTFLPRKRVGSGRRSKPICNAMPTTR